MNSAIGGKIRSSILLVTLVFFALFITACETCKKPYLEYKKGDCCLDNNNNNICDKDESNEAKTENANSAAVKEKCPEECCDGTLGYELKTCKVGYECVSHRCTPIDSDKDGLSDIEERQLGTNLYSSDSDNDGLSDYQEVKIMKTNPNNMNSDGDRLNDKEDKTPTQTNTANLDFKYQSIPPSISDLLALGFAIKNSDTEYLKKEFLDNLQSKNMMVIIKNNGDDYSSWFSFNINTYADVTRLDRDGLLCTKQTNLGKIKIFSESFRTETKISPNEEIATKIPVKLIPTVPPELIPIRCTRNYLLDCGCQYNITDVLEDIDYEKFG